jgi:hypothetical protein
MLCCWPWTMWCVALFSVSCFFRSLLLSFCNQNVCIWVATANLSVAICIATKKKYLENWIYRGSWSPIELCSCNWKKNLKPLDGFVCVVIFARVGSRKWVDTKYFSVAHELQLSYTWVAIENFWVTRGLQLGSFHLHMGCNWELSGYMWIITENFLVARGLQLRFFSYEWVATENFLVALGLQLRIFQLHVACKRIFKLHVGCNWIFLSYAWVATENNFQVTREL